MITKQEMFDRAVRGLASQDWQLAETSGHKCMYLTADGRRCAWGWVDPSLMSWHGGSVENLRLNKIGLAAELDEDSAAFAGLLQMTHDGSASENMRGAFRDLLVSYPELGLTWPEDVA